MNIRAQRFASDSEPIDNDCSCFTCQNHSRAYIRHLFASGELLAMRLATIHNLHFVFSLMENIRESINKGALEDLAQEWGIDIPPLIMKS